MKRFLQRVIGFLSHRYFFRFILGAFIFEACWIAFSAVYPMAFDENFHFGLIQIYSHYWLPFLGSQPPHANAFGAVARDPSYLYHYLMSFPYRLIAVFVHDQTKQIIILRLLNIGLFSAGIVLFRKVLLKVGISRALSNVILLIFILIPVSPLLAAQINYDNLMFPLIALACLLTFKVTDSLKTHKPSLPLLVYLTSLCLLTSLVKYAFLPIFLAIFLYLVYLAYKCYKGSLKQFFSQIYKSWLSQTRAIKVLLLILITVSLGMFIQRDGVNLIKYHNVAPDCAVVLNDTDCSSYSVWEYNYVSHAYVSTNKTTINYYGPVTYVAEWIYWMWYRLFFAVNGPASTYTNYPPLPLPSAMAAVLEVGAFFAIIRWRRNIFNNNPYIVFLFLASALYLIALLAQGYASYRYTDVLENMNGRYLIPVILMVAVVAGKAFSISLKNSPVRKAIVTILAIAFFVQGGGVLTFISRSDDTWYWPNSTVVKINNAAHKITSPVLIDGRKTYTSSLWYFN